jgi:ubiquinone/menaquinone biosynthesis C-methylase UbiE
MKTDIELKKIVKDKYSEIALSAETKGCGCGCGSSGSIDFVIMKDEYSNLDGYLPDADLKLGCGLPTEYAGIKKGDTVIDLGSGAGNDVFVARSLVGEKGKVIGIDMTEEMILKANRNKEKLNAVNVDFHLGEIENLPVENNVADVVISNCVLNLVPDKEKAFYEIFRVLKPGAHFCVSDIVIKGELPDGLRKSAEMYAGCVAGALTQDEYLKIIENTGFRNIEIKTSKRTDLPDAELRIYLSDDELKEFKKSNTGIFSITVVAYKN